MKRTEIVLTTELTPQPGQLVMVFRDSGFRRLREGEVGAPGEPVVIYEVDVSSEAELAEANAIFNAEFYPLARDRPWEDEAKIIAELVPESGAEVLEICCGAGRVAPSLVRGGNRVTAVDLSEACIRHAVERQTPVDFRVADALHLPFADRSFDVVCVFGNSLGVFYSKRREVLAEMVRVCRQRLVLGLREQPDRPDEIQIFDSPHGFLEFSQSQSLEGVRPLLGLMPGTLHYRRGDMRPYGGQSWFLSVDLGTDSAPGSRNT